MQKRLLCLCLGAFGAFTLSAQIGCPGCQTSLPPGLPADTLYLQDLPDGEQGQAYDEDISFRVPKTTTPVHAVDSTTPPGLPISKIEIVAVEGLPPGLNWQPSQWEFQTDNETDGCIRICGTPTAADSFVLTVKLKATVFIITQEASFPLRLYIAPPVSNNDGFSMSNYIGCGPTTVEFTNNNPSGGDPNFIYDWDFGDGTFFGGENPPPHTYDTPGIYPVNYHAVIDTGGKVLASATILDVECVDQLGLGDPDLYLLVKGPDGEELFDSSPDVNNAPLPFTFPINLPLGPGNYTIEVWDEDSGAKGGDDPCGTVSFNILSNDTITSGGFQIVLNIEQPLIVLNSTDTVYVFSQPEPPVIDAPNGLTNCSGASTIVLLSSAASGNQWLLGGEIIPGATDTAYVPATTGYYQAQLTTSNGCTAASDSVFVGLFSPPPIPAFGNHINRLYLLDSVSVPASYTFQWFESGTPIAGETGLSYCVIQNGVYGLVVTDTSTGCSNFYAETVTYNPAYPNCTSGTDEVSNPVLGIFPNPAATQFTVTLLNPLASEARLELHDAAGRLTEARQLTAGMTTITMDCRDLPSGFYTVMLLAGTKRQVGKLVILR